MKKPKMTRQLVWDALKDLRNRVISDEIGFSEYVESLEKLQGCAEDALVWEAHKICKVIHE